MKQIIPFSKELLFDTKIYEVTSISLDHDLKLEDSDTVNGSFVVSGDYYIAEISNNKTEFRFEIPFTITLNSKYNTDSIKIDIDDFYYEIINDEILRVYIDVMIDNIEEHEIIREINNDYTPELNRNDQYDYSKIEDLFKEVDMPEELIIPKYEEEIKEKEEEKMEPIHQNNTIDNKLKSLFDSFANEEETYTTYHVHIVREEDSIEKILLKYKISKEELALYNKIDTIALGDKLIIPSLKNE